MEPKPLLRPHLKALREQGVVLTELDKNEKPMEEIMDLVVCQLYKEDEVNKLTGKELIELGSKCVELTFGDEIEKK
jgi:DNA-binding transcriptional ArsR family regulator